MREADELTAIVETTFSTIQRTRMEGVPVLNTVLAVRLLGVRKWEGFWLGTLLTPWFMNLILLPETPDDALLAAGTKRTFRFPAGSFEFIRGYEPAIGPFWMCSLFSPVFEFTDQETAEACALSSLEELFEAAEAPSDSEAGMAAVWRGDLSEVAELVENAEHPDAVNLEDAPADHSKEGHSSETGSNEAETTPAGLSRRGLLTGNRSAEVRHEP